MIKMDKEEYVDKHDKPIQEGFYIHFSGSPVHVFNRDEHKWFCYSWCGEASEEACLVLDRRFAKTLHQMHDPKNHAKNLIQQGEYILSKLEDSV